MKKLDWIIFTCFTVVGFGFYLIEGESISDRYGWQVVVIPILLYLVYSLSKKVDDIERRIKVIEAHNK